MSIPDAKFRMAEGLIGVSREYADWLPLSQYEAQELKEALFAQGPLFCWFENSLIVREILRAPGGA